MLFGSTSLAARIERAECRLLTDTAEAVARRHPGADVLVRPLAGGVACFTVPGSPLNKVAHPTPSRTGDVEVAEIGVEEGRSPRRTPSGRASSCSTRGLSSCESPDRIRRAGRQ